MNNLWQKTKQLTQNLGWLLGIAWETDSRLVFWYYLSAIGGGLLMVFSGVVVKMMIDNFSVNMTYSLIMGLIILRFGLPWIENVAYWSINLSVLDYLLRYKLQTKINYIFHQKTVSLDVAYYENDKIQNLLSRVKETMIWSVPDVLRELNYLARSLAVVILSIILLWSYGWWIPILVLFSTIPRLIANTKIGRALWSMYGSGAPEIRKFWYFSGIMSDPLAVRELKIFQAEKFILEKYRQTQMRLYELNKKPIIKQFKMFLWLPLLETSILILICWIKVPMFFDGIITVGSMLLLMELLLRLSGTVSSIAHNVAIIVSSDLFVADLREVMLLPALVADPVNPVKIEVNRSPRIEFDKVVFCYPGTDKKILNKVSFVINPNENVALVGSNGAGKTTIVKLLCRFYDPTSGKILINGVDIKNIDRKDLYKMMGTLFQEFMKYHFTIRENIALAAENNVDFERMNRAAKMAELSEFIDNLPSKYEQILGKEFEDGTELSGGQWQKLAIARAFYEQSPVLILDEPTSAIDAEAEFEIFSNLQQTYLNKTLVFVSHRFSTVRNADKILVVENGKISEQGTHQELLKQNGKYATMFLIQAKGYES